MILIQKTTNACAYLHNLYQFGGLVLKQVSTKVRNSTANALELRLFCAHPPKWLKCYHSVILYFLFFEVVSFSDSTSRLSPLPQIQIENDQDVQVYLLQCAYFCSGLLI